MESSFAVTTKASIYYITGNFFEYGWEKRSLHSLPPTMYLGLKVF
jgi:hypothetical protein